MIQLGQINTLEIIREAVQGLYIADEEGNEVLLPNRYIPENFKIWDKKLRFGIKGFLGEIKFFDVMRTLGMQD